MNSAQMCADAERPAGQPHSVDEQDIIDLLELQRLSRELLDHLTAMFPMDGGVLEVRRVSILAQQPLHMSTNAGAC